MKQKFIDYYMQVAELTGKLSYATRRKVGAVIVKDNRILSYGYNGMPTVVMLVVGYNLKKFMNVGHMKVGVKW